MNQQAAAEPWTIQRLLVWTAGHFESKQCDSPRLAAEVLLSEALECKRIDLYARFSEVPQEPALGKYRDWVRRHAAGEPVAYLVGYRDFYSLRFRVSKDVLIPRPETEQLVLETINACKGIATPRILDIGTGSGCIAVTLAKQIPAANLVAIDISMAALGVATENAAAHNVADRIQFVESDLDAALAPNETFDVIVSNPPYIGRSEIGTVDKHVSDNEPHVALYGGEKGTEIVARIVELAPRRLNRDGKLLLEISPFIASDCVELIKSLSCFAEPRLLRDLDKHDRVLVASRIDDSQ